MEELNSSYPTESLPKKKIFGLLTIIFLSLSLIVALTLVKQRQIIQKKAAFGTINIGFRPSDSSLNNVGIGTTYSTKIWLTAGDKRISGVDFRLFFDPNKIELISINRNNSAFPYPVSGWEPDDISNTEIIKTIDNTNGTARFVFVNRTAALSTDDFEVAEVLLKRRTTEEAKLYFYDYRVNPPASVYEVVGENTGDDKELTVGNIDTTTFTFVTFGEVTPTPTTVNRRDLTGPQETPDGNVNGMDANYLWRQPFPCGPEYGNAEQCTNLNLRDISGITSGIPDGNVNGMDTTCLAKQPFPCGRDYASPCLVCGQ